MYVRNTKKTGAIPHRLKAALKERGFSAENLAAFFGVSEERAKGWLDHTNRFPPLWKLQLRDNFLNMGIDEFLPINEELGSVQFDAKAEKSRWGKRYRAGVGKRKVRPLRYCKRVTLELNEGDYKRLFARGRIQSEAEMLREVIDYGIRKNAARIKAMEKVLGISLADWREHMAEKVGKGKFYVSVLISPVSFDALTLLALANGTPINRTVIYTLREFTDTFSTDGEK